MSEKARIRVATRDVPPLEIRADIAPSSFDAEKRTVDVVWGTGVRVRRGGYWTDPFDEELDMSPSSVRMDKLSSGKSPVFDEHMRYGGTSSVRGVVVRAAVDGKKGTATLRFAKPDADPEAEQMFRKIGDGIITNVSVGYRVFKYEKQPKTNQLDPNEVPVMRAIDWEPFEVSPCSLGADSTAEFRSAQERARSQEQQPTNTCEFITRSEQPEENAMDLTPAQKLEAEKLANAARAAELTTATDAAAKTAAETATKVERERHAAINGMVRAAKLEPTFGEKLITDGVALDKARAAVIDELAKRSESTHIESHHINSGDDAADKLATRGAAWLIQRAGLSDLFTRAKKAYPERFKGIELDPEAMRGYRMADVAREYVESATGKQVRGQGPEEIFGQAIMARSVSGAQSTSDFSVLLENVMNKTLLAAYLTTPDTWQGFCMTSANNDFRAANRYRHGTFGVLDPVGENGEFKNKKIPDATKATITVKTKGNIIAITRQSLINDDLDAFSRLAVMLGRSAKLSIEVDVYALLAQNGGLGPTMADTLALFDAGHGNLGAASAISVIGLDADRVLMLSQKDQDGNEFLELRPSILLVPASLGATAKVINDAQYDPDTANKLQRPNSMRAVFNRIIDTPRIAGTRRYLFADPGVAPVIDVAFYQGVQEPFLENRLGWRIDGTELKVRLDYGVGAIDTKGAITNFGA